MVHEAVRYMYIGYCITLNST